MDNNEYEWNECQCNLSRKEGHSGKFEYQEPDLGEQE